jgi:hypothetical protein
MLNIEKYKDGIIKWGTQRPYREANSIDYNADVEWRDVVNWLVSEYQEPLLTEEEKELLQDLKKWYVFDKITVNYVYVNLLQGVNDHTDEVVASITLPSTLHGMPFARLDYGKIYPLEELEL